jgi:hypothetical protein
MILKGSKFGKVKNLIQEGTELGVRLNSEVSNLKEADLTNRTGKAHLEGDLMLNYVKVRCIADIEIKTLEKKGYPESLSELLN